jgi:4-methylaminobutanoate oxidase (formaldehyde-forming)
MIEADEPIDSEWIGAGEWTVQIANSIYPATVSLRPLYDPQNLKIKA